MRCPYCNQQETEVLETRLVENDLVVRRRRHCLRCQKRFTTYERIELTPVLVIKRDGRRERFDREKLKRGILKACEKTRVDAKQIDNLVKKIETQLKEKETNEIESRVIGQLVANHLKKIDKVAYIRFASVFRRFVDLEDFEKELKKL